MKCQYCNEHEAVNTFWISFPGGNREIHLCDSCTHAATQYFNTVKKANPELFQGGLLANRIASGLNIPVEAGEDVKNRLRKNILQAQLEKAIQTENYEEAARLRDIIAAEEKDVYAR